MRLAIIIAALLAAAPAARADTINDPAAYAAPAARAEFVTAIPMLSLDTSLGSVHFPSRLGGGARFNDFNPGLGLEWPVTTIATAMTGVYRNSYDHPSFYAAMAVTPWAWRLEPGGWRWLVRPGLMLGLVSGYSRDENPVAPLFGAGLLQIRDVQTDIGINLIGLPRMDGQAGFVGIQIVTPLVP